MNQQNSALSLLPSGARTTAYDSGQLRAESARGVQVILNVSAVGAPNGTLTVRIKGYDKQTGAAYYLNAAPTGVTGTGTTVYEVRPDSSGTGAGGITQTTNAQLPYYWGVEVNVSDANSMTYSLSANLLL